MTSKKSKVKNIRNVLESPFHIHWLEKTLEEITPVQDALKELLPAAKLEQVTLNRDPKTRSSKNLDENRKCRVKEREVNVYRSSLALGFQSVIRGLERNQLCCVVIASDIYPALLLKVALSYAQTSNTPALLMPDLRAITKSTLGFSTMVLGLKNIVAESQEHQFFPIFRLVSQNPTVLESSLNLKEEIIVKEKACKVAQEPPVIQLSKNNFYLFRGKSRERVFVPESVDFDCTINSKVNKNTIGDFISLDKTTQKTNSSRIFDHKDEGRVVFDDDSDDVNSDNDAIFFIDTKADSTLLKPEPMELEKSSTAATKPKHFKKKQKFGPAISMNLLNSAKAQNVENPNQNKNQQNRHSNLNKPKKANKSANSCSEVKFKPLKIKTYTSNPNRIQISKKKK